MSGGAPLQGVGAPLLSCGFVIPGFNEKIVYNKVLIIISRDENISLKPTFRYRYLCVQECRVETSDIVRQKVTTSLCSDN